MGKCVKCDGTGKEKYIGEMTIIYSTCTECGGTGTDYKPQCSKHKNSKYYHKAAGWCCSRCEREWSVGSIFD